jgi:cell fate regulator YaaT (PSP1 superfamily)
VDPEKLSYLPHDGICCRGYSRQDCPLHVYDYMADVPGNLEETDFVEVQFKNTRKGYYLNANHLDLVKGDVVAVEASPGHDIGTVTLTGGLVALQMKKAGIKDDAPVRRVYRKARPVDMEKFEEAKRREHKTMIESRQIALDLGLQMKIGDVEYQGDGGKAIFYYIADGRVDFRQLIKVLAEAFHVRIEMKQIGARQEAGRIGGFGPCGRELCCATWMSSFVSVSTGAARTQDLTLSPQKLAGQCAKLKCCMNFEVDAYAEALRRFPARDVTLETAEGTWYFFKADILRRLVTYSTERNSADNLVTISAHRAFDIMALNREGKMPESLSEDGPVTSTTSGDLLEQDSLTRFDRKKKKRKPAGRPSGKKPSPASDQ